MGSVRSVDLSSSQYKFGRTCLVREGTCISCRVICLASIFILVLQKVILGFGMVFGGFGIGCSCLPELNLDFDAGLGFEQ